MSTSTTSTDAGQGTSSPSPSPTQSDTDTATLYLFTFLATILILVLLSASLVLRSYVLRRRYRRRFQQVTDTLFVDLDHSAFNGGQFDPLGLRRPARRFGPKPHLWDIWTHPVDDNVWSSLTPVAVRCTPPSPPPSVPPPPPASPPPPSQPSLFSHLRLMSPFSHSPRVSPSGQLHFPSVSHAPPAPSPSADDEKGTATLAICVLVAMPDASAPVYRSVPDAKGKGVDPLESASGGGDADPLMLSSPPQRRSGQRLSDAGAEEDRPPLLEFGIVEVRTMEGIW